MSLVGSGGGAAGGGGGSVPERGGGVVAEVNESRGKGAVARAPRAQRFAAPRGGVGAEGRLSAGRAASGGRGCACGGLCGRHLRAQRFTRRLENNALGHSAYVCRCGVAGR